MYLFENKVEFYNGEKENSISGGAIEETQDDTMNGGITFRDGVRAGIPLEYENMKCYQVPLGVYCHSEYHYESSSSEYDPEKVSVISDDKLNKLLDLVSLNHKKSSSKTKKNIDSKKIVISTKKTKKNKEKQKKV